MKFLVNPKNLDQKTKPTKDAPMVETEEVVAVLEKLQRSINRDFQKAIDSIKDAVF